MEILAIPASSAPCESTFSDAKSLGSDERASMGADTLNGSLMLRDYLRWLHPSQKRAREESDGVGEMSSDSDLDESESDYES